MIQCVMRFQSIHDFLRWKFALVVPAAIFFLVATEGAISRQRSDLSRDTIARIGQEIITARELRFRLESMPRPRELEKTSIESVKVRGLYALIAERLLADEGRLRGGEETPAAERMKRGLESVLLRDALYRYEVKEKRQPTDAQIHKGLSWFSQNRRLIAFLVGGKEGGDRLKAVLRSRIPSDPDLRSLPQSAFLAADTIIVEFGTADTVTELAAFSIGKDRVSAPFQSPRGEWAVLLLLGHQTNPQFEKRNDSERRRRVTTILQDRLDASTAEAYYFSTLSRYQAQAEPAVFDLLAEAISKIWRLDSTKYLRKGEYVLTSEMVDLLADELESVIDTPLVRLERGSLALGELVERFRYEFFSSRSASGETFRGSLNAMIKHLVAGDLLAHEARNLGLQNSDRFREDMRLWQDFWTARSLYYRVRDTVAVTDDDLRHFLMSRLSTIGRRYEVNVREVLSENLTDATSALRFLDSSQSLRQTAERFSKRKEWAVRGGESGYFVVAERPAIGIPALLEGQGRIAGPLNIPEGISFFEVLGKRRHDSLAPQPVDLRDTLSAVLLREKQNRTIDQYIAGLAQRNDVSVNFPQLAKVQVSKIPMITRRMIGFGGTMNAAPLMMPLWKWAEEFNRSPVPQP